MKADPQGKWNARATKGVRGGRRLGERRRDGKMRRSKMDDIGKRSDPSGGLGDEAR